MLRATFLSMEPYFNDVCEAYFIQTNGKDNYTLISELATLYFNVEDELEAVAYLLRVNKGGADCMVDKKVFARKPS